VTDLAGESSDQAVIAGLGKLTAHYNDAQAMLLIGKTALARGLPMDLYAFPDLGVPNYSRSAPKSIAAWSMPLCAQKAASTSAICRRLRQSD
jgi:hypothetical protein